jgi:hypothetical protein
VLRLTGDAPPRLAPADNATRLKSAEVGGAPMCILVAAGAEALRCAILLRKTNSCCATVT